MKTEKQLLLLGLLLASAVGASAGIVSSVMTSRAIDAYAARLLEDQKFIALAPRKGVVATTYEESLKILREESLRSLAVVLQPSLDVTAPGALVYPKGKEGMGVVVSADGWVLFTSASYPKESSAKTVDIWVDHQRYAIEREVRDTTSPLVLIKLANASGLPAVRFGGSADEVSGTVLFAGSGQDALEPVVLTAADEAVENGALPAEMFTTIWRLQKTLPAGTPLFSAEGGLDGFALQNGQAFPLHHSRGLVQDVVRTGGARATLLGVYTLDLSRAYNLAPALSADRRAGALIISPGPGKAALLENGPAKKAGLMALDIIQDIDGEAITYSRTLAEILAEYEPGEIANIRYFRQGQLSVVPVTLGDSAQVVY